MVDIDALPSSPAPERSWAGCDMLVGGKGYASAPLGQLHYRDVGPRESRTVLLLLHQSPLSMVEFGAAQNSLAKLGIRSIAPDTPGYGLSDPPGVLPCIGGFADNLIALLDHLSVEKAVVGGHHTGACIASAFAARHPERTAGVILHGCPVYNEEEGERFRGLPEWDRSPKNDGSHIAQLFIRRRVDDLGDAERFARTWMSVAMFLQGPDIGHWAVNRYDMTTDLKALKGPGLIITEGGDMIHYMDERAHQMRPDFSYRVLAEKGSTGLMTDPDGWARLAAEFLETAGLT